MLLLDKTGTVLTAVTTEADMADVMETVVMQDMEEAVVHILLMKIEVCYQIIRLIGMKC